MNAIDTAYVQLAPNTVHGVPRARRFRNLRPIKCVPLECSLLWADASHQPSSPPPPLTHSPFISCMAISVPPLLSCDDRVILSTYNLRFVDAISQNTHTACFVWNMRTKNGQKKTQVEFRIEWHYVCSICRARRDRNRNVRLWLHTNAQYVRCPNCFTMAQFGQNGLNETFCERFTCASTLFLFSLISRLALYPWLVVTVTLPSVYLW